METHRRQQVFRYGGAASNISYDPKFLTTKPGYFPLRYLSVTFIAPYNSRPKDANITCCRGQLSSSCPKEIIRAYS
jgi:hypothetical protein